MRQTAIDVAQAYLGKKPRTGGVEREAHSKAPVNLPRLTNLGKFRAYAYAHPHAHRGIREHMTLLVRRLEPNPHGLRPETFCFTATTEWGTYEVIQSDIFDHLLAIHSEFRAACLPVAVGWRCR